MTEWSLTAILAGLHEDIQQRLDTVRKSFQHPGTKGDGSETVWRQLLDTYLPKRYQVDKAHIVDSEGHFSDQIDVVIFDRQYSPFIFHYQEQVIVPAESVYAVFEARQTINAENVRYAQDKVAGVRRLHRTSLPIPHAGGTYPAKPPTRILGGILTFESDWQPPFGTPFKNALQGGDPMGGLDLGCVAAHGYFCVDRTGTACDSFPGGKPATTFLLQLIAALQFSGTVPMIDVNAYARWLSK